MGYTLKLIAVIYGLGYLTGTIYLLIKSDGVVFWEFTKKWYNVYELKEIESPLIKYNEIVVTKPQ